MGVLQLSDGELARACRQGDARAWRELIRRFTPQVFRLACRMTGSRTEAEDVTQEVFMRIHRSFDRFDSTRPLSPWVSRITYNACLRRIERDPTRRGVVAEQQERLEARADGGAINPEGAAASREEHGVLEEVFGELASQDRALLTLRYREGLSDAEVADATGMPVNTVKTRIFRARRYLRQALSPLLRKELS